MGKISIFIVDDVKQQQDTVEELIYEAYGNDSHFKENVSIVKFFWPHKKPESAVSPLAYDNIESNQPHVIFSDILWDQKGIPYPQEWGIEFAKLVRERYQNIVFQLITKNPTNSEQTSAFSLGYNSINIADKHHRSDQIRKCLYRATKFLTSKLDSVIKKDLLSKIGNWDEFQNAEILIQEEKWKIQNLFIIYWNNNLPSWYKIKELLLPDITLVASECFGIWGVKQITHGAKNYFPYNTTDELKSEIKRQFQNLFSSIEELKNMSDIDNILKNISYENDCNVLLNKCLNSTIEYPPDFDIECLRDSKFRYGSPATKKNHHTEPNRQIITFKIENNIIEPTILEDIQGGVFEVNIPIHNIFEKAFQKLLVECNNKFSLSSFELQNKIEHPSLNLRPCHQVKLYENLMIFRQSKLFPAEKILSLIDVPDFFRILWDNNLEYFGKYFIISKIDNQCEVFDCTSQGLVYKINNNVPINSELLNFILKDEQHPTYHIFTFNSWRQG
jgi:hypothetical protein